MEAMSRTQRIMDAALARGLREKLPGEWFGKRAVCPKCAQRSTVMTTWEGGVYWCRECDGSTGRGKRVPLSHFSEAECHIGPDLTDERNLWALLRVCDAVNGRHVTVISDKHGFEVRVDDYVQYGPTRTAAGLAALEAALGIKENDDEQG